MASKLLIFALFVAAIGVCYASYEYHYGYHLGPIVAAPIHIHHKPYYNVRKVPYYVKVYKPKPVYKEPEYKEPEYKEEYKEPEYKEDSYGGDSYGGDSYDEGY